MTKPVEAASTQVTAGPYYNINEYSGQLYKWSVERLNPDNLVCLPVGCLGVLVSLVARVVEGALMLVVNFCLAVKGVVWGHTPTVAVAPANANASPTKPPATDEAIEGKKAKKKEKAEEADSSKKGDKTKKAAKKADAEEATPPKKADKKSAAKKVETDDVEEESGSEDPGEVTDTEEEVNSPEESGDEVSGSEAEETEEFAIPKVPKPDFDALEAPAKSSDTKTAPTPFKVDWDAAGINDKPKWGPINLKQPKPPVRQLSLLTTKNAKRVGSAAAAGLAATMGGLSLPFILPVAAVGGLLAAKPDLVKNAWNSLKGLGPDGCKANREKARKENEDDDGVIPPAGSAPKVEKTPNKTVNVSAPEKKKLESTEG
jgi:hypothetical protein